MTSVGIKELKAKLSNYVNKAARGEEEERRLVKKLSKAHKATWSGKKPAGVQGVQVKGKPLSETVRDPYAKDPAEKMSLG